MVQTDRQNRFRNVLSSLKDLSNDIWHAYQSWKLVGDEENNIATSPTELYMKNNIKHYMKNNMKLYMKNNMKLYMKNNMKLYMKNNMKLYVKKQ